MQEIANSRLMLRISAFFYILAIEKGFLLKKGFEPRLKDTYEITVIIEI